MSLQSNPQLRQQFFDALGLNHAGRYEGNIAAARLLPGEFWSSAYQQGLFNEILPMGGDAVKRMLMQLQNPEAMSQEYRSRATGQANEEGTALAQLLKSRGGGIGAQQGAMVHSMNQGRRSANDFDASLFGPTGTANRMQGIMGLVQGSQPNYGGLGNLHGITTGTPRNQTGAQVIGGLAGQLGSMFSPVPGANTGARASGGMNWMSGLARGWR